MGKKKQQQKKAAIVPEAVHPIETEPSSAAGTVGGSPQSPGQHSKVLRGEEEKLLDDTLREADVPRAALHNLPSAATGTTTTSGGNCYHAASPGPLPNLRMRSTTPGGLGRSKTPASLGVTPRVKPPPLTLWQRIKAKVLSTLIYVVFVLPALWLRAKTEKYTKAQTLKRQIKKCEEVLSNSDDAASWENTAAQLDQLRGLEEWVLAEPSNPKANNYCNASAIIAETQLIYQLIHTGNTKAMGEFIRTHLMRNSHGSASPELFKYYTKTKRYVHEYNEALAELMRVFALGDGAVGSSQQGDNGEERPTATSSHSTDSDSVVLLENDGDLAERSSAANTSDHHRPTADVSAASPTPSSSTAARQANDDAQSRPSRPPSVEPYQHWLDAAQSSVYTQSILDFALKNPSVPNTPRPSPPQVNGTGADTNHESFTMEEAAAEDSSNTSLPGAQRLKILVDAGRSYGRSCLMLSGGAALGVYHIGVIKAFLDAKLLPKIICGSSAGALVASIICSRTDQELEELYTEDDPGKLNNVCVKFFEHIEDVETSVTVQLERLLTSGGFQDTNQLKETVIENSGHMTFLEAFERTGRILNVSVAADREGEKSVLLNYINSPHVTIWSGVCASCCMPGMFGSVELSQKDPVTDEIFPYMPGQKWFDGSVANDLPKQQLAEMFNCNYFIVSQVNPHVVPFAKHTSTVSIHKKKTGWKKQLWFGACREVVYWLKKLYRSNILPKTGAAEVPYLMATQDYEGDLTIYPIGSVWAAIPDFANLTTNPSQDQLAYVTLLAQKRTRPFMNQIRTVTQVERALETEIKHLAETVELGILRKSPSFNAEKIH